MSSFMKRPMVVLIEAVVAAAMLSACGGGGSDTAAASADVSDAGTAADAAAAPEASAPADGAPAGDSDAADSATGVADGEAQEVASGEEPQPDGSTLAAAFMASVDEPPVEDPPGTGDIGSAPDEAATDDAAAGTEAAVAVQTDDAAAQAGDDTAERESAQSLSVDYSDRGYAKPKVAAIDFENNTTTARRDLLAKFKFVILGGARIDSRLNNFASSIKSKSPNTKVASYTLVNELKCSTSSSNYLYPLVKMANSTDWWLRYANGSRAQWTSAYGACDMNISKWGRKNSAGRTWMQEKARFDYDHMYRYSKIDYVFSDNTFWRPRVDADWKRIDTNQSRKLSEIQSAQRNGHLAYWNAIKGRRSSLKVMGNADSDLAHYEFRDRMQGAFFEGAMGRSWSIETWAGWSPMMERYRALIRNTVAPNDVLLQAKASPTNYRAVRYGLASAMMENGWFVHGPSSGTIKPYWFDDYDAPIGKPVQSPPTAPKSNGIWMRKYENGIVLVNPKSSSASIYVGSSYKRLKGTQDPYVNNGRSQSTVTLPAKSGLIMIRR